LPRPSAKPKQYQHPLGDVRRVALTLFPKAVDQILSTAYKVFPNSPPPRVRRPEEMPPPKQVALAPPLRGVTW